MKALSKITLGVVSILSLCSSGGKGSKVTREKFFEKVNELKTDVPYKKAKITCIETNVDGKGKEVDKVKNTYSAIFEKNE